MADKVEPPVKGCLHDAARALQFVRSKAAEWNLVSSDDPPIYLFYSAKPGMGQEQKDPTHTSNFGVKLQERCVAEHVDCELNYPGAPEVKHQTIQEYLVDKLTAK